MSDQLVLLDPSPPWRLDSPTRERGRRGVAAARAVLQTARGRAGADRGADDHGRDNHGRDNNDEPQLPTELAPAA